MSGSTIGGIVGGVIGFAVGGPLGGQIGYAVGSLAGAALDPQKLEGPKIGDLPVQTAQEGTPRAIAYGMPPPFSGNLCQIGPPVIVNVEEEQGKGGGPIIKSQRVYQTYMVGVCEGPRTIIRVWRNGKLVLDRSGQMPVDADGAMFRTKALFYTGDETQMPDATLEGLPQEYGGGIGNVPAYRGTTYMVVIMDDLTELGGAIPQYQFQVAQDATIHESCEEEGLFFWYPLDDYRGPGTTAREVINGWDGLYAEQPDDLEEAILGAGPALSVGSHGSLFLAHPRGYMFAALGADNLGVLGMSEWSLSSISVVLDEEGGNVYKNIATWFNDVASGYHGWAMGYSGAPTNMEPFGGVGLGNGDNSNISATGAAGIGFTQYLVVTWKSNDGNPLGAGTMRFYVNGGLIGTLLNAPNSSRGATQLVVGGAEYPDSIGMKGYVQDVKGYTYELSHEEVIQKAIGIGPSTDFWQNPDAPGTYVNRFGEDFIICHLSADITGIFLDDVEIDLMSRVGISEDMLDVEALEDIPVQGYLVGKQMQCSAALIPLAMAYFFDHSEHGGKIHAVPRGLPAVADLTPDDFIDDPDDRIILRQKIELPRRTNMAFSDPAANYARVLVFAERESANVSSTSAAPIEMPMVFDRDIAAAKVDILTKVYTEEAMGRLNRKLPTYRFAYLTAGDAINYGGKRYRIERLDRDEGETTIEAPRDRASNYSSIATANGVQAPTSPVSNIKGPTVLRVLQIPRQRTMDNSPGVYLAATGLKDGWPGAVVYISTDGGVTEQVLVQISARATMGRLGDDIGTSGEPIPVDMFDRRELSLITEDQAALGINRFAMTTDGLSEMANFLTPSQSSSGDWYLYDVTRGLQQATGGPAPQTHNAGDDWTLIDSAVIFVPLPANLIGQTITLRGVTRGTPRENNPTISFVFQPLFTGPDVVEFYEDHDDNVYTDHFLSQYRVN